MINGWKNKKSSLPIGKKESSISKKTKTLTVVQIRLGKSWVWPEHMVIIVGRQEGQ